MKNPRALGGLGVRTTELWICMKIPESSALTNRAITTLRMYHVKSSVRSGIRTHAHIRGPEHPARNRGRFTLESGALDRSAILTYGITIDFLN